MISISSKATSFLEASSRLFATSYELSYDCIDAANFAKDNWYIAIGFVAAYVLFISLGGKIMERVEKAFELRICLGMWNALLCIFSFVGMWRTVPYLLANILSNSYEDTVCVDPSYSWSKGPVGFWVMLFCYSKIPELIDTVFIILRKRPLIFLHWYHHVTVLLFCWSAFSSYAGSGLYFVAMNYSVHALMYGYYCLQAFRICPKSFPAILITLSQITQMFVGTGVCISCWYYKFYPTVGKDSCHNDDTNLYAGAIMYGSYLYLFCDFFVRRYLFKSNKSSNEKPGKASIKKVD